MLFPSSNSGKGIVRGFWQLSNLIITLIIRSQGWWLRLLGLSTHPFTPSSEFKEAFPAGRFRPVCKIQAKRGASSAAVADSIKPPDWWHSTRIMQAFDLVLQDKVNIS